MKLRVRDVRTGNILGPFKCESDARLMALQLNDFVFRNAGITSKPFRVCK